MHRVPTSSHNYKINLSPGQSLTMSTGTHINIRWYCHQLLSTSMKVTFPQIHGCRLHFLHVSLCASQPGEFPIHSPSCSIKGSFSVSIKLLMPRKQSILSQQCPHRCALPLTLLCWTAPPLWFPELKGADLTGSREAKKKRGLWIWHLGRDKRELLPSQWAGFDLASREICLW